MRWTVRRLQELLARFRDERWELHSPRPGWQARQWAKSCPPLAATGAADMLERPWDFNAQLCRNAATALEEAAAAAAKEDERIRSEELRSKLEEAARKGTKDAFQYLRQDDAAHAEEVISKGTAQTLDEHARNLGGPMASHRTAGGQPC